VLIQYALNQDLFKLLKKLSRGTSQVPNRPSENLANNPS
jgi:hypothetical protein